MSETTHSSAADLLHLSAQIVSAHVSNNAVTPGALPALIRSVHAALAGVDQPAPAAPDKPQPAVPIKRSVFPDYLICLEDGAKVKMLKRLPEGALRPHARAVSRALEPAAGLPDGRSQLRRAPLDHCQAARPRPQARLRRRA